MVNVTIKLTDQQFETLFDLVHGTLVKVRPDLSVNQLVQECVDREVAKLFLQWKPNEL